MDKSQAKKSFILYNDQRRLFQKLAKAQVGELMECIFAYADGEAPHIEDPLVDLAFEMIAAQMDRDMEKYKTICEKRSENAKKQWEQFKRGKMQVHADASTSMQEHASTGDNDNENENENDIKKILSLGSISWSSLKEQYLPKHVSFTKWFLLKQKEAFPNFIKEEILPNCKRVQNSLTTLEQLCRIDQFDFETEVEPILRAVVGDDFWARNILSLSTLRNKSKNGETKFVNIMNTIKMPSAPKKEKSTEQLTAELEKE